MFDEPKQALNPRDFEEFHEANALQRELFFYVAEKVIRKSTDLAFLNKCLSLMTRSDYKNVMLGQAIANAASRRMLALDAKTAGLWRIISAVRGFLRGRVRSLLPRRSANVTYLNSRRTKKL